MKHFALAGNPNCGKTTLFNSLTGSTAHVGNWPGVTVDKREGKYKSKTNNYEVDIVDLPGIYSLSPYTPEEVISRNYILDEKPDCVINIIDATNLERNLYLTTQLLEMDVPVIVALNMMDIVTKNGDAIDEVKLQEELGVPVVKISALLEDNLKELMDRAYELSEHPRQGNTFLKGSALSHLIGDVTIAFRGKEVANPLFHAIKLVENDEIESANHKDLLPMVEEFKKQFSDDTFGDDFEALVADERYKYITKNFAPAFKKHEEKEEVVETNENGEKIKKNKPKLSISDKVDKVLTNRWAAIPIFLVILFLIFHFTFSENLFWIGSSGCFKELTPWFGGTYFTINGTEFGGYWEGLFWTNDGINSIGVILQSLLTGLTDMLTDLARYGLMAANAPEWCVGFLCDGVLGGLFAVLSFLPQILLLFLFFSILEDSGYMARVAFILDRIFRKFGLSGRAFMPMIMGFGCSVPAMINTRTLADEKERVATVRVIPFFSCGAKLPILTAIAGGICQLANVPYVDLITYSMYVLGVVVAICAVILMRNTTMRGKVPPFIMELPAYHMPQFKSLMIHLWDKLKHFVKKAFTIILVSTIVIWFVSHFAWNWTYLPDEQMNESILAGIGQLVQPLFTPLGFGSQIGKFGWVFAVAAVTGLIAKENVIATFGTLAACIVSGFTPDEALEGVDSVVQLINNTGINTAGLIAFIAFNMLTIPCFAACATAKAELPKNKFWTTILFWVVTSYFVASMIYLVGTWWWTVFIFVAVIALAIVAIVFWNKNKNKKERLGLEGEK